MGLRNEDLEKLKQDLRSKKTTERKNGLKALALQLSNLEFVKLLDRNTLKLRGDIGDDATSKIKVGSWAGVCYNLTTAIEAELLHHRQGTRTKKLEPLFATVFKDFMQRARSRHDAGVGLVLTQGRRVSALAQHMVSVLSDDAAAGWAAEYRIVLRDHLLPFAEYARQIFAEDAWALMEIFMGKIKERETQSTSENSQNGILLELLLRTHHQDLTEEQRRVVERFFRGTLSQLNAEAEVRLGATLTLALNTFLLRYGLDLTSRLRTLHHGITPYFRQAWRSSGKDVKMKGALVAYLRVQASLGEILQVPEVRRDLYHLVEQELVSETKSIGEPTTLSARMSFEDHAFLELAALLSYLSIFEEGEGLPRRPAENPRAKRPHTTSAAERVVQHALERPWQWMPVLAMLIKRYRTVLPASALEMWLAKVYERLHAMLADGTSGQRVFLWVVRCLEQLAAAWPSALGAKPIPSAAHPAGVWTAVWDTLHSHLQMCGAPGSATSEAALHLLASTVQLGLVRAPQVTSDFWLQPVFDKSRSPSPGVLAVMTWVLPLQPPQHVTASARESLVEWVMSSLTPCSGREATNGRGGGGRGSAIPHFLSDDVRATARLSPRHLTAALMAVLLGVVPEGEGASDGGGEASDGRAASDGCWWDGSADGMLVEEALGRLHRPHSFMGLHTARAVSPQGATTTAQGFMGQSQGVPGETVRRLLEHACRLLCKLLNDPSGTVQELWERAAFGVACVEALAAHFEHDPTAPHVHSWRAEGAVVAGVTRALQRASNVLGALPTAESTAGASLGTEAVGALQCLVELLSRRASLHASVTDTLLDDSDPWSDTLRRLPATLTKVITALDEAQQRARREGVAGVGAANNRDFDDDNDDDDMYDADLDDEGAAGGGANGQPGGGGGGGGVGPIAVCTQLMQAVAGWCPKQTAEATIGLMNPRVSGESKRLVLGVLFDLIKATSAQYAAAALDALRQLCDELDMDAPTRCWALKQLETLCTSLGTSAKERFAPLATRWEAIMGVAMVLTAQMEGEEETAFLSILLSDDGRVQLGDTLAAHMRVAPQRFQEECVLWEGELQRGFAEVFMTDLLNDPNYRVRARMADKVALMFALWDGHWEIFEALELSLWNATEPLSMQTRPEVAETRALALSQIALNSETLEPEVVFRLCVHASACDAHRQLVIQLLGEMARKSRYPSRHSYIAYHLPHLAARWIEAGLPIVNRNTLDTASLFELQELMAPSEAALHNLREFGMAYAGALVPYLVLIDDVAQAAEFARACSDDGAEDTTGADRSDAELIAPFFVSHVANIYANLKVARDRASDNALDASSVMRIAFKLDTDNSLLNRSLLKSLKETLANMLRLAVPPKTTDDQAQGTARLLLPMVHADDVIRGVNEIKNGFTGEAGKPVWEIMLKPNEVWYQLAAIHCRLTAACASPHKLMALGGISVLMRLLEDQVCVPLTFRYLLHILLELLGDGATPALREASVELLQTAVATMLRLCQRSDQPEHRECLQDQLHLLLTKLLEALDQGSPAASAPAFEEEEAARGAGTAAPPPLPPDKRRIATLLQLLAGQQAPAWLWEHIGNGSSQLEPIPAHSELAARLDLHEKLQEEFVLERELSNLAAQAASMDVALRRQRARHLLEQVRMMPTHRACVQNGPLQACVWQLLVAGLDKEEETRDLIAELLVLTGPVKPEVALDLSLHSDASDVAHCPLRASHRASAATLIDTQKDELVDDILHHLEQYLTDVDVRVIKAAVDTAEALFFLPDRKRMLSRLTSVGHGKYLGVFMPRLDDARAAKLLKRREMDSPPRDPLLWSGSLWTLDSTHAHDRWIRHVVSGLLPYTANTALKLCHRLVRVKAPFAEMLFPHVVADLASGGADEAAGDGAALLEQLSACFQRMLQQHDSGGGGGGAGGGGGVSLRTMRRLLDALNFLRARHHQMVMLGLATPLGLPAGAPVPHRQTRWDKAYMLNVDYLVTAAAALRAGACFTALLYTEFYCEQQYGSVCGDGPELQQLLLDIYRQIDDPDAIYSVLQGADAPTQLCRHEHEGSWGQVLEGCDQMLRVGGGGGGGGASALSRVSVGAHLVEPHQPAPGQLSSQHEAPQLQVQLKLLHALQNLGCLHVAQAFVRSLPEETLRQSPQLSEAHYEAAWRTGQWDVGDDSGIVEGSGGSGHFHQVLFSGLKLLRNGGNASFLHKMVTGARDAVVRHLEANTTSENLQAINPAVVQLEMLSTVDLAHQHRWGRQPDGTVAPSQMVMDGGGGTQAAHASEELVWQWKTESRPLSIQLFALNEPLLALRSSVLRAVGERAQLQSHLLEASRMARKAGHLAGAASVLHEITDDLDRELQANVPGDVHASSLASRWAAVQLEQSKLMWARGETGVAIGLTQRTLERLQHMESAVTPQTTLIKSRLLQAAGKWLARNFSQSAKIILNDYLQQAALLLVERTGGGGSDGRAEATAAAAGRDAGWVKGVCRAHYRVAMYAISLQRSIHTRLQSAEWRQTTELKAQKEQEVRNMTTLVEASKSKKAAQTKGSKAYDDLRQLRITLMRREREIGLLREEERQLEADGSAYLQTALVSCRSCLLAGSAYDLRIVFQLIALWFEYANKYAFVNEEMAMTAREVLSYKFIPVIYQLVARIGSKHKEGAAFQSTLHALVARIATDHPYHAMYQVFALKNHHRIGPESAMMEFNINDEKSAAANEILSVVRKPRPLVHAEVAQVVEAYIKLAQCKITLQTPDKTMPPELRKRKLANLQHVPVLTHTLPVDKTCKYAPGSFPHFAHFEDKIQLVGGINVPKLVECVGSDGRRYKQLVKTGSATADDLRQDAVMEQLFEVVNNLLQDNAETRMRQLGIRTYKVIPLTPRDGLLEWVEQTIPLATYLLGSNRASGAHAQYRPQDWKQSKCRETLNDAGARQPSHSRGTERLSLRAAYDKVCANFHPVMHYFFLEKFREPSEWYLRRLTYTRSVAANSMVGYLVGLGDRHSANILMDKKSAEVIQIDLGCAFEQGKTLSTPEMVPFRLTRDIVDGMGITGVEGTMRRCCEKTIQVLRNNKEVLLTIMEVFIHDPLYMWALTTAGASKRQADEADDAGLGLGGGDGDTAQTGRSRATEATARMGTEAGNVGSRGNADAERVLTRIRQKLDGYEDGELLSISGQVQRLMQDARDPDKLCRMYPGWAPWV